MGTGGGVPAGFCRPSTKGGSSEEGLGLGTGGGSSEARGTAGGVFTPNVAGGTGGGCSCGKAGEGAASGTGTGGCSGAGAAKAAEMLGSGAAVGGAMGRRNWETCAALPGETAAVPHAAQNLAPGARNAPHEVQNAGGGGNAVPQDGQKRAPAGAGLAQEGQAGAVIVTPWGNDSGAKSPESAPIRHTKPSTCIKPRQRRSGSHYPALRTFKPHPFKASPTRGSELPRFPDL